MTAKTFIPLVFVATTLMLCSHMTDVRGEEPAATATAAEPAPAQEPAATPAPAQEPAAAPASPSPTPTPGSGDTALATMSPAEIRSLVDTTISENEGLRKIIADMSGNTAPVISIDKEPDAVYPYYDVYIGAQSGEHGWRLFTFIIDPRTKTLKVECTDVTGFDKGTVDEFVSAYNACEDINPAK